MNRENEKAMFAKLGIQRKKLNRNYDWSLF